MGAIVGLVGQGSSAEVQAMLALLAHRGARTNSWSPAAGVYFGWRGGSAVAAAGPLVWDQQVRTGDCTLHDVEHALTSALAAGDTRPLARLRGFFALAHWNADEGYLTLATDHVGWKSVYYAVLPDRIAFASEYKAFYALADFVPAPCKRAIQEHQATWRSPARHTFLEGVHSVPPASTVEIRGRTHSAPRSYWDCTALHASGRSRRESERMLRSTLTDAVRRDVAGFRRVALTLSGGLDAPIIAAVLRCEAPEVAVHAYTAGTDPLDPEVVGAQRVAEHFGIEHHTAYFDVTHVPQLLPSLIWLMEDCTGREETLLQHIVYNRMQGSESCVFTGYGADGLFGGMPRHRLVYLAEQLPLVRRPLLEVLRFTQCGEVPTSRLGRQLARLLHGANAVPPPRVHGVDEPVRLEASADLNRYLAESLKANTPLARFIEPLDEASGTVGRHPFYDVAVMDLAATIPSRDKMSWTAGKRVLRNAFADLLPDFVLRRPKTIQRVKHDLRLSDVLHEMCGDLLTKESLEARKLFDVDYVANLRKRARGAAYDSLRIHRLWALLSAEIWARIFIDSRSALANPRSGPPPASTVQIARYARELAQNRPVSEMLQAAVVAAGGCP
jgi:asparagine synthase (glutamine-hydrolysing)